MQDNTFNDASGNSRVSTYTGGSYGENATTGSHGTFVLGIFVKHNKSSNIIVQSSSNSHDAIILNSDIFEKMHNAGVRIYNNSYGSVSYTGEAANMYGYVGNQPEEDSIFVWAAGNEGKNEVTKQYASPESLYPLIRDNARNWLDYGSWCASI